MTQYIFFMQKKILLPAMFCCLLVTASYGQDTATQHIITADSLASGNYKDIFTSFFQLAFNDLTGANKSLQFNSNPYAIMLRHNSNMAKYPNYRKYTYLRNLNFDLGAKLDSSYRFNGMTVGLKYAIINNRDYTIKKQFLSTAMRDGDFLLLDTLTKCWALEVSTIHDASKRQALNNQFQHFFHDSARLSNTDTMFQRVLLNAVARTKSKELAKLVKDTSFNIYKMSQAPYDSLIKIYQNRALWTIGVSDTSYNDGGFFKNVQVITEYAKGLLPAVHNYNFELDIKASVNFADDTLLTGRDLRRQVFVFEPGINFTLRGTSSKQSWFECKIGGSYSNVWRGQYAGEDQIVNTLNATVRILVLNKFWLPLAIKYDRKTHNVFGFLNITTNFNGLADIFGAKQKKS